MEMPQIDNNNENEIVQTENTQEAVKTTDLFKLLKKLTELQAQSALVKAGKAVRTVENGLETKVDEFKKYIEEGEKKYRPRHTDSKKIQKEYSDTLVEIYNIYKQEILISSALKNQYQCVANTEILHIEKYGNDKVTRKSEIKEIKANIKEIEGSSMYKQYDEMISMTQKDLQKAVKSGDTKAIDDANNNLKSILKRQSELFKGKKEELDSKKQEIQDLKMKLKLAKENLKATRNNVKEQEESMRKSAKTALNAMSIDSNNKDKQLIAIKTKNAIFKLFDSIRTMVGGDKKFSQNIVEPIKKGIETVKREKIPEIQAGIYARLAEEELKLKQFEEKAKETATKGKEAVINTKDKVITGAKTVGKTSVEVAKTVGRTGAEIGMTAGGIVVGGIYLAGKGTKNTIVNVVNAGKEKKESFLRKMANKLQNKIDSYENKQQAKTDIDRDEK